MLSKVTSSPSVWNARKVVQPPPSGGLCHLLRLFGMSVGDAVTVGLGDTISNTVGSTLEALDDRLLLVRINVELDKQDQVAAQNPTAEQSSRLGPRTVSHVRRLPIVGGETRVCSKVYREEVNNELSDLHRGQVLLPPNLPSTSGCVVVVIHQNVNREVKGDDDPGDAGATVKLGKAQESSDGMVVHMQESERFLLQDEENGVDELEVLEIVVDNIIEL